MVFRGLVWSEGYYTGIRDYVPKQGRSAQGFLLAFPDISKRGEKVVDLKVVNSYISKIESDGLLQFILDVRWRLEWDISHLLE